MPRKNKFFNNETKLQILKFKFRRNELLNSKDKSIFIKN